MQKLLAFVISLVLGVNLANSQVSIYGSTCITNGTTYSYYSSGYNSGTYMSWCVTGGYIVGASSCKSGTPLASVQIIWYSSSGTINLSTSNGNASMNVYATTSLSGGSISSNLNQTVSTNIPSTITCYAAAGGNCPPSYSYQWQSSIDNINWTNISGATGLNLSFTTAPSQTTYYRRKVTETNSGSTAYSNTATVYVTTPLSPGSITSSSQTVSYDVIPATINASPASGGTCSGNYSYQWQYSYDGLSFDDMDSLLTQNLVFQETLDSNTYFRRRVVCGTDTAYTSSQMITVNRLLAPGTITSGNQTIITNATPAQILATAAQYGSCSGSYAYQWQQSTDGFTFTNITSSTSQNLSFSSGISNTTFYRRKATCGSELTYTNTIAVSVKQIVVSPPVVKNEIDSLLESAGVNIASLFSLYSDTVANNRNDFDSTLLNATNQDLLSQQLGNMDLSLSTLTQSDLDSLMMAPLEDSIALKLVASSAGGSGVDSLPYLPPFLDDNIIQLYRSTGNYNGLDSLVGFDQVIPIEEVYAIMADSATSTYSQASSRILPIGPIPLPFIFWKRSAVINGPTIVTRNQVVQYTATFNFPVGNPSDIRWVVVGGSIISQNINPANGTIYVNINWSSSVGVPYVAILDLSSWQYQVLPVVLFGSYVSCRAFPVSQTVYYSQLPSILNASSCNENIGAYSNYQWQVLDVYSSNNWTDISGATSPSYQPPALTKPWLMYRRLTKVYNSSNVLLGTYPSSAVSVKMQTLNPGTITAANLQVQYNTIPTVSATSATGGFTTAGSSYGYTWEYSTNGGQTWTSMGTSVSYPSFPITANTKIRRIVQVNSYTSPGYTVPTAFIQAISNEISLISFYQTADYENRNYIRENVVQTRGIQSWENADALAIDKKVQTTTYLDGLSRPIQVVGKGTHYDEATSQWYDMVQSIAYEAGGRIDKSLLPYPSTENIGKYKNNVATDQPAFYAARFGETNAFARVDYDGSPLNRTLKSYAPGSSWSGSNVGISGDAEPYDATENVKWFTIGYNSTNLPVSQGTYPSLFLIKSYGKDEKLKKVVTYTDRMGHVVLKKVQLADDGVNLNNQYLGWLSTYYVYNDFGQLRYTITPKAVKELEANNWVMTQEIADGLCFWYDYDDLGRVIAKKTPSKGVEYIVYDKRNRPVYSQDANQRAKSPDEWLATFYDDLNRPVLSGIYKSDNTRDQLQTLASSPNTLITVSTTYGGVVKLWGSPLTATDINNTSIFTQLSFSYYDDYTYSGAKTFNSTHTQNLVYKNAGSTGDIEQATLSIRTLGISTGGKSRIVDGAPSPVFLVSSIFYDEEGRGLQTQSENIKTGVDIVSTQYHFDGRILSSSETHNGVGTVYTNFNILTKYKFDKTGRVIGIGKKINNTSRSYIASPNISTAQEDDDAGYKLTLAYKFDELGRMVRKTLSPNGGSGGTPLETLDYSYNIRGWLTGINKDYALGEYNNNQWDHFFGLYIGYDNADGKFAAAQKNGQITGVQWKSQGDNTPRKFDYVYDNANRLLAANYSQRGNSGESWNSTKADFSTKDISYDENGNLLSMKQMGILPGANAPVTLDNLVYSYTAKTNKLIRVDDYGTAGTNNGKQSDFKDGENAAGTNDYTYDDNGNLIIDNNKRVTAVAYNYLDKPELLTIAPPQGSTGGGTIKYIYSTGGSKLQKIVTENASASNGNQQKIITTTYIGSFVYEAVTLGGVAQPEVLQMIGHEEGRIRVITPYINVNDPANYIGGGIDLPGGKQGVFDYFITDNLATIRTVITEEINKSSSVCTMETDNSQVQQYEESIFGNPANNEVVNTRFSPKPSAWASNTSSKVSKLQSPDGTATQTGPNVLLRVMAGDLINAKVDYYYLQNPGSSAAPPTGMNAMLQTLGSALTGGKGTSLAKDQANAINANLNGTGGLQTLMNSQPSMGVASSPRAYLNYIFFDEQFNYIGTNSGFVRVSQAGDGASPIVVTGIKAPKNGYAFVFLTNGSSETVYFDNFTVSDERGRLIEENHYYAHGLKIAAISSKALSSSLNSKMVNYGFQGAFAEEVSEFELNYNEFSLRTYDPQIGRWTTPDPYDEFPSPYTGMGNDPGNNVDPSGGSILSAIWGFFGGGGNSATASALRQVACPGTSTAIASIGSRISTSLALGFASFGHSINDNFPTGVSNLEENYFKVGVQQTGPGPVKVGTLDYYIQRSNDFIKRNPGKTAPTYYLSYGNKYIRRFKYQTAKTLSPKGRIWLDKALINLQQAMEDKLTKTPDGATIENNDNSFSDFAFETHVKAYEDAGVLGLSVMDKVRILLTPDAKDLFSDRGLKQASKIAGDMALYYLLNPIFAVGQMKEALENRNIIKAMIKEYVDKNQQFFEDIKSKSKGPYPVWVKDPEHFIMQSLLSYIYPTIII